MAISIAFLSDVREVLKGAKQSEDAFEDVADSLDDLAKEGQRAGDKLADGLDDAETAAERVERSFRELAKEAEDSSKRGSNAMRREFDEGTSAAKRDLAELGNEARQNAAETFSSFDGSAQSFADGIQGTLGGIVSSLGPGGAIAGALGAIGIGLAVSGLELSEEAKQEFRESVSELTAEYIEFGQSGTRSADAVLSQLQSIAAETDVSKTNMADWKLLADQLGVPIGEIANGYLNGGRALDDLIDKTRNQIDAEIERASNASTAEQARDSASRQSLTNARDELAAFERQKEALDAAREAHLSYLESGGDEYQARVAQIEAVNDAYDEAAGAADDFINEESGLFDVSAFIASMDEREAKLIAYQDTLAKSALSPEARQFLNDQGFEAADAFLTGYQNATPEQQARLNAIWSEAGRQNSGEYATALQDGMPETVEGPTVVPKITQADLDAIDNKLAWFFRDKTYGVGVRAEFGNPGRDVG